MVWRLYEAVDADYPTVKNVLTDHECKQDGEHLTMENIIQTAWFNIGFAAALRRLGVPTDLRGVDGANEK
jgi:hypothetical protein